MCGPLLSDKLPRSGNCSGSAQPQHQPPQRPRIGRAERPIAILPDDLIGRIQTLIDRFCMNYSQIVAGGLAPWMSLGGCPGQLLFTLGHMRQPAEPGTSRSARRIPRLASRRRLDELIGAVLACRDPSQQSQAVCAQSVAGPLFTATSRALCANCSSGCPSCILTSLFSGIPSISCATLSCVFCTAPSMGGAAFSLG